MGEIALSVLICSIDTRWDTFAQKIQSQIWDQYAGLTESDQDRVEIIILTENRKMMLGEKRNIMVDIAQGEYVVFVDDDDRIEPDYLETLLAATRSGVDCITFHASVSVNQRPPKLCKYSIEYRADRNTPTEYLRIPNHICAVKRDLARKSSFPNIAYGEDRGYSTLLRQHLATEHNIPRVLYHYDYDERTSETQKHRAASLRRRESAPVIDIIFLSSAKTGELRDMTQTAVDTCISGANSLPVNVIVIEQQPGIRYNGAKTFHRSEAFRYNTFANLGAREGAAEWIMVANNDVVFADGWLHKLLAVDHPFVSPKDPTDSRQRNIVENTIGDVTGKHMSGWCFAITRELWEKIGGFSEVVDGWFSDDAVLEQCKSVGVLPMLVTDSIVEHLGSVTLNSETPSVCDELTWGQLAKYEAAFGKHRLSDSPKYHAWLSK